MSQDQDMIPTKETNDFPDMELDLTVDSDAALLQQRMLVAKLSRDEVEDRYLRLLEENTQLKKHACKQEEKIKKLATKLIRVISEKKRMEVASGGPGKVRDIETEELIEDQQQRIREVEKENKGLKEKLLVAKNHLLGTAKQPTRRSPARRVPPRTPSNLGMTPASPSPAPQPPMQNISSGSGQLINQQAMRLLEEARNENRMLEDAVNTLREQVNIYEQEVDQIKEQGRIKESNFEEEISILKTQLSQNQKQTVTENIEMIRLQRENKVRAAENQSLKAQMQGLEENINRVKIQEDTARRESEDLLRQLQDEQRKTSSLSQEISSTSSSKQALYQAQEKLKDLLKDNGILKEANEKLLNSAFDIERERKYQATENSLKVQISQLETTLKSDLNDKKRLTDALATERENYAQLESDFQDLQSKFLSLKEDIESQDDKMNFFARDNAVDMKELEEALLHLKQKKDIVPSPRKILPSFMDKMQGNDEVDLKKELSELQVQHIEAVNEIDKTRNLLRVQININNEQKKEITILHKRLGATKLEIQDQLSEYQKLLELRSSKIQKLENQLRETIFGTIQNNLNTSHVETGQVHGSTVNTAIGQSLFEINIQKISLDQNVLMMIGLSEPRLFLSWVFYDSDQSYSPVLQGPTAFYNSSSYYKVKLDDSFLEYLVDTDVMFQVHLAINNECQTIAAAFVKFSEIVDYPQNKLHGTTSLVGVKGSNKDMSVGSLDYWFKLHTHDNKTIRNFVERRENNEQIAKVPKICDQNGGFLLPERKKLMRNKNTQESVSEESLNVPERKALRSLNFPTKSTPKPPRLTTTNKSSEVSKVVHSSLSKDCAKELNNIIAQREKNNVKYERKTVVIEKTEVSGPERKKSESQVRRSILKSFSGKHVNSEDSSLIFKENDQQNSGTDNNQIPLLPMKEDYSKEETEEKPKNPRSEKQEKVSESSLEGNEPKTEEQNYETENTIDESSDDEETEDGESDDELEDDGDEMTHTDIGETSGVSSGSEVKPAMITVTSEVHTNATVADVSNDSHDSEGVVTKTPSLPTKDNIIIVVSEFEAAPNAAFTTDENVSLLYVEYSFLDIPTEELETPFSLPKPSSQERITFNFRKVFNVERSSNSTRRRLVSRMLRSAEDESRLVRFKLVSEPPDSQPDLDCEDIGVADVDLGIIDRTGKDLLDQNVDVFSIEHPDVYIGTLIVSIQAAQAFKSIKS